MTAASAPEEHTQFCFTTNQQDSAQNIYVILWGWEEADVWKILRAYFTGKYSIIWKGTQRASA